MSFLDKIESVLREAGTPLRADAITERLLQSGVWSTTGKTPAATVQARIAEDVKHNADSRFVRTGKGTFGLKPSAAVPISSPPISDPPATVGRRTRATPLSFVDAAERILERYGAKRPMHYREITAKALELGLLSTSGKTPQATLYAQILTETERRERRGERPRFVKHGRGFVGLARWNAQGLEFQIERHNEAIRKQLHERIRSMAPADFEALIGVFSPSSASTRSR
ncbi:MAG: winged helix-turn-helix domain-containing protein [Thermoanaerobaculia bacterium]